MTASAAVIEIHDTSDEEDTFGVARLPRGRPAGMDRASWKLIQQLQAADGNEVQVVSSPKKRPRREVLSPSLALASKLQAEEENRHRLQQKRRQERELLDNSIAEGLQKKYKEEDDRVAKICRPTAKQVFDALQPCQQQAVSFVQEKAKLMHEKALPALKDRVVSLGLNEKDLTQCLDYVRDDAPIIIHLSEATLSLLTRDTHYRNLFETHTSGGSKNTTARGQWEKAMFGDCYDSATPFDRPKYGCLNVTGDIQGVPPARVYGPCFLILHQHVRHRATFFDKDTGGFVASKTLATSEYYAHILNGYSDEELKEAIHVASVARVGGAASTAGVYKEVQIHGPVCLETDIQALSVPGAEATASSQLKKDVLEFQKKAKCNVLWQQDLLGAH